MSTVLGVWFFGQIIATLVVALHALIWLEQGEGR
jgi:hypothetical protein